MRNRLIFILLSLSVWWTAWGWKSWELGWFSDDYALVHQAYEGPQRSIQETIFFLADGHPTIARILCYPFLAYTPLELGVGVSHLLQSFCHLVNGLLLGSLLTRLRMSRSTTLFASALFLCQPWISQPILWWSAVCTSLCTGLTLVSGHFYLTWLERKNVSRLVPALLCFFVALLFYELWLAGFLFFFAMSLWRDNFRNALRQALPFLAVSVVYLAIYAFLAKDHPTMHRADLSRSLLSFVTIHYRHIHWITDTDWFHLFGSGLSAILRSWPWHVALPVMVFLASRRGSIHVPKVNFWRSAICIWLIFLGSRLVFCLQAGGVSAHTRHTYGAGIAFALAVAGLASMLPRRMVFLTWSLALGFVVVSAGLREHYIELSRREKQAYEFAKHHILAHPERKNLIFQGTPPSRGGEFNFYSQFDGGMLTYQLSGIAPGVRAFVTDEVAVSSDAVTAYLGDQKQRIELPRDESTALFRWDNTDHTWDDVWNSQSIKNNKNDKESTRHL